MSHAVAASSEVGSEKVEEFVQEHPRLVRFARIGWVSKGIVYALVGVLALTVAFAAGSDDSRRTRRARPGRSRGSPKPRTEPPSCWSSRSARALRTLADRHDRVASQERGAHMGDPPRLRGERHGVPPAGLDGGLLRPPR